MIKTENNVSVSINSFTNIENNKSLEDAIKTIPMASSKGCSPENAARKKLNEITKMLGPCLSIDDSLQEGFNITGKLKNDGKIELYVSIVKIVERLAATNVSRKIYRNISDVEMLRIDDLEKGKFLKNVIDSILRNKEDYNKICTWIKKTHHLSIATEMEILNILKKCLEESLVNYNFIIFTNVNKVYLVKTMQEILDNCSHVKDITHIFLQQNSGSWECI